MQLGSGALLAAVACIILLLTKLAVWAFEHLKVKPDCLRVARISQYRNLMHAVMFVQESLYICFVIDKNDEVRLFAHNQSSQHTPRTRHRASSPSPLSKLFTDLLWLLSRAQAHSWLNHYLAKQADGTRNELYDPTRDFDSEDGEGGYSDMDDDDDSEAGDSDEELLGSQTAGAGPTSGVLLEARGGRSKRLMSRVIPGERQVLQVEGRKVWVQRQPAVAEDEENDGGRGQHNGRRNNNNNNAKADSAIKKGAFKVTVNRHLGPETFSSILAAARSGFLSSRRGRLLTYEAVASQNNNGGGGGGYDDDNDLCWDDGGGVGMGLGAAQSSIQLAWHYAPSCRAVAPGQIIFPQGLEGTVDALVADVGTFLDSASWYAQRGIPYRRGYIIHGPAGCGKSMTAAAVATALKLPVYIVDLANPVISDEWLASLLNCVPPRSVIVFDRIDRAFDAQRKRIADPRSGRRKPSAALSFSGLLNALDGVCAFEVRCAAPPAAVKVALLLCSRPIPSALAKR